MEAVSTGYGHNKEDAMMASAVLKGPRNKPRKPPPSTLTMCGNNPRSVKTGGDSPRKSRLVTIPEIIWETMRMARCGISRQLIDSCVAQLKSVGLTLLPEKRELLENELKWMTRYGTEHNLGKRTGELVDALLENKNQGVPSGAGGDIPAGA